jgi:hypothetical protein
MTNFSKDEDFFLSKIVEELSCAEIPLSAQELALLGKRGMDGPVVSLVGLVGDCRDGRKPRAL